MTEERTSPLRQRMIEDMRIRGMGDKAQKAHIRAIKDFAAFLGHSPDTATPEELRAYQLHMTNAGVTPSTFNARIVALRFFFGMTCGREELLSNLVSMRSSCGGLILCRWLDAVDEIDALNDVGEMGKAA